jgi:hypothetical protein
MIDDIKCKASPVVEGSGKGKAQASPLSVSGLAGLSEDELAQIAEFQGILDELNETVASAKDGSSKVDIASLLPTGEDAVACGNAGITTIGFGASSLAVNSASAAGVTTIGFGGSTFAAAPTSLSSSSFVAVSTEGSTVPMLVAKKKIKRMELDVPSTEEGSATEAADLDDKAKKLKPGNGA